ncbi:hypothetical protein ACFV0T_34920 [Streptomyces sp. NPDC059582]|uniref:hypothetical protein n=1 Tax=Streptomyces sp. NPDC059582 TaxID=3346875 RepID=UPI00368D4451
MSSRNPGAGGPSRLDLIRHSLSEWKPRIVKWSLALVGALGIAAEIIDPLGETLKSQGFLGGSFAALIALILFDAISESEPREVSGVYVLAHRNDLHGPFREAFEARHVRVDFSGFTMETLLDLLKGPLERMADEEVRTQELTLRIIVAHLNLPMSLPGRLDAAPEGSGRPAGTFQFADSAENRQRMRDDYTKPNWQNLKALLNKVHERNQHIAISCEIRESPQVPERKCYILNQEKFFHQPYGIMEADVTWNDNTYHILDTAGIGLRHGTARVIGWDRRSNSRSTREIAEHHMEWHRNLWNKLTHIKPEHPVIRDPHWIPPEQQSTD